MLPPETTVSVPPLTTMPRPVPLALTMAASAIAEAKLRASLS
jgi:hypothetical protein